MSYLFYAIPMPAFSSCHSSPFSYKTVDLLGYTIHFLCHIFWLYFVLGYFFQINTLNFQFVISPFIMIKVKTTSCINQVRPTCKTGLKSFLLPVKSSFIPVLLFSIFCSSLNALNPNLTLIEN